MSAARKGRSSAKLRRRLTFAGASDARGIQDVRDDGGAMTLSPLHRLRREARPPAVRSRALLALVCLSAWTASGPAFAEDHSIPRLPAPFLVPDLTHDRFDAQLDWTLGRLTPERGDRPGAFGGILRTSIETGILPRRLYLGTTLPIASALPPDGGLAPDEQARPGGVRTLVGNIETHIRAIFPLPSMMEIGFVLGVVAPTATFDRGFRPNRSVAEAVASFDPTSYVHFLPGRVGLRVAGDARLVRGPFVFQGRHGFDVLIDDQGIDSARVAGRLVGHVGFQITPTLLAGIEGSQIYFFASDDEIVGTASPENAFAEKYRISDDHRASFTVGPTLRYAARDFDIGAALVTNTQRPLSPATDGFFAFRFSLVTHIGKAPP